MTPTQEVQGTIRQYLLGKLSDGSREEIERDLLTNDEVFDELLIIEEELTDEYLSDSLKPDERSDFERHFLAAPERQEDLRFASALNKYVTNRAGNRAQTAPPGVFLNRQSRSLRMAAAAAVVVIMVSALWLYFFRQSAPPNYLTLTLMISSSTRGDGVQVPRIRPAGNDTLRIFLRLPSPPPPAVGYRVTLLDANGESSTLKIAGQDSQSVMVEVPGSQLGHGQYALKLSAIKADGTEQHVNGSYYFNIE